MKLNLNDSHHHLLPHHHDPRHHDDENKQAEFPNFSWRGYAGFSQLQDEVISMHQNGDDGDFDDDCGLPPHI